MEMQLCATTQSKEKYRMYYFLLLSSYENSSRNQNDNYAYIVIKIAIII